MINHSTLQALREALSNNRQGKPISLREFGTMLGRAVNRKPYTRGYVSKLLRAKEPITPPIERAARVLMLGAAALGEDGLTEPMPTFDDGPIGKIKAARAAGIEWQELYARDTEVREFVDALMNLIVRG